MLNTNEVTYTDTPVIKLSADEINSHEAIRKAEYLAELKRRAANIEAGKNIITFTSEEWEKFVNEQGI